MTAWLGMAWLPRAAAAAAAATIVVKQRTKQYRAFPAREEQTRAPLDPPPRPSVNMRLDKQEYCKNSAFRTDLRMLPLHL